MLESLRAQRIWIVAILAASVCLAASYGVYKMRRGDWGLFWRQAPLGDIRPEIGYAYQAGTGRLDLSSHERPSPAMVLEDGRPLGPANAQHADIRQSGRGRYSFWHDHVYLSSSDGSDPRTNGRRYAIAYPPVGRRSARALYAITALLAILSAVLLGLRLRRLRISRRDLARAAAVAADAGARTVTAIRRRARTLVVPRYVLGGIWLIAIIMFVLADAAYLMRVGGWTDLWREEAVGTITPELGFAFVAHTGRPQIASHRQPEPTALYENGVQVGLRNALHAEIREVGQGRYSFWFDYVIFSTPDNSDPRTNGRRYTYRYPPISRTSARMIYVAAAAAMIAAMVMTLVVLAGRDRTLPSRTATLLRSSAVTILNVAAISSLVAVGVVRAAPSLAQLVPMLWTMVAVVNVVAAAACYAKYRRAVPHSVLTAFLVAVAVSYYFLTVSAPHRSQGCHATEPIPVWAGFCVAPDSASYYFDYTVGSTRQPLYPWFIAAATANTGFSPRAYIKATIPGAMRRDPGDPLFRVVRLQIVLLLVAALVACAAVMYWLRSPLPAVAFVGLYDQQFFSAVELNIVLTEPLVQAFLLLLVAAFAAFFARMRPRTLVLAAAAAGLAYLTRQAALYQIILLAAMMAVALFSSWRQWWRWCAAAVAVFCLIGAVPDLYAFAQTGDFSRQQESLQYQYRIAHAMQYARPDDVELMPDEESRSWLADAIVRRDLAHRRVDEKFPNDELNRMIYYIAANLYEVATPIAGFPGEVKTPQFYMRVATPILRRHWIEYAQFSFRFWQFGLTQPGWVRLHVFDFSPWYSYAALFALALLLRGPNAVAAAALIIAHWAAVAIICLAAVPIPRMINASELLVVVSAVVLMWEMSTRLAMTGVAVVRRKDAA